MEQVESEMGMRGPAFAKPSAGKPGKGRRGGVLRRGEEPYGRTGVLRGGDWARGREGESADAGAWGRGKWDLSPGDREW